MIFVMLLLIDREVKKVAANCDCFLIIWSKKLFQFSRLVEVANMVQKSDFS